jgi:uncharacterized membrane protein HdeD (DUF308 family)
MDIQSFFSFLAYILIIDYFKLGSRDIALHFGATLLHSGGIYGLVVRRVRREKQIIWII